MFSGLFCPLEVSGLQAEKHLIPLYFAGRCVENPVPVKIRLCAAAQCVFLSFRLSALHFTTPAAEPGEL